MQVRNHTQFKIEKKINTTKDNRVQVYLSDKQKEILTKLCGEEGRSYSNFLLHYCFLNAKKKHQRVFCDIV